MTEYVLYVLYDIDPLIFLRRGTLSKLGLGTRMPEFEKIWYVSSSAAAAS